MDNNDNNKLVSPEEMERRRKHREAHQKKLEKEQRREERYKKTGKRALAAVKIILTVCVVLSLLFVAAKTFGNVTFTKAVDAVTEAFSNLTPGKGYPYTINAGNVVDIEPVGGSLAVLAKTELFVLNSTAKTIQTIPHTYSTPGLDAESGRMVMFDRATGRYMLLDRTTLLNEGNFGGSIYDAAAGKKGSYAIAGEADDACSSLKVYDSKNKMKFEFFCAKEYIISVDFSSDEEFVCAAGISTENTTVYSMVYVLNAKTGDIIKEFRYDSATVIDVAYTQKKNIAVIADNMCSFILNNEQRTNDTSYGYCSLDNYALSPDGRTVLLLSKYSSVNDYSMLVFSPDGTSDFSKDFDKSIVWVSCNGSRLAVLDGEGNISCYSKSGTQVAESSLGTSALRTVLGSRNTYALTYSSIDEVEIKTIKQ